MRRLAIFIISIFFYLNLPGQTRIYISKDGDDNNPGTLSKPLLSFEKLQKKIHEISLEGTKAIEVIFLEGKYRISEPVKIENSNISLVYRAKMGELVTLTSGISIPVCSIKNLDDQDIIKHLQPKVAGQIKMIDLNHLKAFRESFQTDHWPDRFRGYAGWPELYIKDIPMQLSRWPNEGYAKIKSVIKKGAVAKNDSTQDGGIFLYNESNPSTWDMGQDIYLGGYWCFKWYDEIIKVRSIDKINKEITLEAPHQYGIGGPSGGLYYAINLLEELDLPGEYVYDRKANKIYLLLPNDVYEDDMLDISLGNMEMFLIVNSQNITFKGIEFSTHSDNAFEIKNSKAIILKNCIIKNISKTAVNINGGEQCGVDSCHIFNIGEACVMLDGGERKTLQPSGHFTTNSQLHHFARHVKTYQPAVGASGVGQKISTNYIHDAPHNAILFWGNDHIIENNRIERVCLNTSDAGAIYTGRDWTFGGTIIRGNYITALGAASHHHNWGIYLDDMAAGIEVIGNIIVNSPSGILLGGGRNNIVSENLIVNVPMASIIYDARAMNWARYHVERYDGVMWQRLFAMPYDQNPWKERFPYLLEIKDDDAGQPKHNIISKNYIYNSPKMKLDKAVRKFGTVEKNLFRKHSLSVDLQNGKVKIIPYLDELKELESFIE